MSLDASYCHYDDDDYPRRPPGGPDRWAVEVLTPAGGWAEAARTPRRHLAVREVFRRAARGERARCRRLLAPSGGEVAGEPTGAPAGGA